MVSDETYDICLPVLQDPSLEEEDKIDKLESLLKKATTLQGQSLENAVLDAVWRYREGGGYTTSPPPIRQTILRRPSPASWRGSNTPLSGSPRLGVSPLAPPGYVSASFTRSAISTAASPFNSPRPSPRLGFVSPAIPHSPSLNAYEFASDNTPAAEIFGDSQQTDNVDWLVSDDNMSVSSSLGGSGGYFGDLRGSGTGGSGGAGGGGAGNMGSGTGTATPSSSSGLNAAAPEFSLSSLSSQQTDMTPYDMLRSILGPSRTDDEIDAALAMHGYDLGATIAAIMDQQQQQSQSQSQDVTAFSLAAASAAAAAAAGGGSGSLGASGAPPAPLSIASSIDESSGGVLIGKSMTPDARPSTPADQKSGILCKFFLSTGQCLRADCRFSHDLSNHICKYWVAGNCLAGNTCVFSHDPANLMTRLTIDGTNTPPLSSQLSVNDYNAFPILQPQPGTPEQLSLFAGHGSCPAVGLTPPPPGFKGGYGGQGGNGELYHPRSRPSSRHQMHRHNNNINNNENGNGHHGGGSNNTGNSGANQAAPPIDDTEAFPSLGSAVSAKGAAGKKHHGKRGGHGHHKDGTAVGSGASTPFTPSSLADIVKMSPSPAPESPRPGSARKIGRNSSQASMRNGEGSAAAQAIPTPKHIPWLETGEKANKAYLKARQEAIKHGGLRNKFLQSAAQAWNRNDARAAKALSLRGQSENDLMRKAHREAARELYEERNKAGSLSSSTEIYVDLHGLHPEEAVEYLERVLLDNGSESRPVYAITGTGHHSKNGKDKVGKAVRNFLNEWRYAYREFSVPSDRNNMGGILGIDARSWDKSLARRSDKTGAGGSSSAGAGGSASGSGSGSAAGETADLLSQGVEIGDGKVKLLVRDSAAKDGKAAKR